VVTILAPLALAPTHFDKFFYRNVVASWPLLAVGLAIVLASATVARAGVALLALACLIELGSLAIILHRPALQRDDWRSATRALSSIPRPLVVVTNPSFDRLPIELYRPEVRPLPSSGASVREIVFLGFGRLPLEFDPLAGFARVEERRIQHIALVRYRAAMPVVVTPGAIAAHSRFSEGGVLLDPRPTG
jgi:hypothetical protein